MTSESDSDQHPEMEPTWFDAALLTGELQPLRDTPIYQLIQQAAHEVAAQGIADEVGALRILLARLVTEERNLEKLTESVTKVVRVALDAARTRHQIGNRDEAGLNAAVVVIQDEIADANGESAKPDCFQPLRKGTMP